MLVRYLEQQAAIAAALTGPEVRQHARNIDTLDTCDIVNAEDLVKLLNPLKTATTVLCEEKTPTVSLIVPLKNMIEQSMAPNDSDSPTVTDVKRAILTNISGRYSGDVYNYLLESTALDPRFQTLPQLDHDQREAVFQSIKKRIEQLLQNQPTDETSAHCSTHWRDGALGAEGGPESEETEPATKKTALEDLLGQCFPTLVLGHPLPERFRYRIISISGHSAFTFINIKVASVSGCVIDPVPGDVLDE
ncbi:E3 SUMO-protein ligase ZBED1-like [Misgurnus anguillicaudatus]|uniref:E3 SUMO-protein ligase ZBED1-like n=1 Tax=Misgurnus anguillicaudatus TaxID=75329 RepID=UPI003CCFA298